MVIDGGTTDAVGLRSSEYPLVWEGPLLAVTVQ
jgi:hypothetical protein